MTADLPAVAVSPSTLRRYRHESYSAKALVEAKGHIKVSVCLPARNEEATVGHIVEVIRRDLMERAGLVDEVVVADDGSNDATANVAEQAGATVVAVDHRPRSGKGAAMAAALAASRGEVLVFLDADVANFGPHFVVGLLGPLLCAPDVGFVKASYRRPLGEAPGEGGRVTELLAKPLLELFHPALAQFAQPLAGELATYRFVIAGLDLPVDYGVDVAMLIDVARRIGFGALAEVDLGERIHRNRPLAQLAPQARAVLRAVMARASEDYSPASCLHADGQQLDRVGEDKEDCVVAHTGHEMPTLDGRSDRPRSQEQEKEQEQEQELPTPGPHRYRGAGTASSTMSGRAGT